MNSLAISPISWDDVGTARTSSRGGISKVAPRPSTPDHPPVTGLRVLVATLSVAGCAAAAAELPSAPPPATPSSPEVSPDLAPGHVKDDCLPECETTAPVEPPPRDKTVFPPASYDAPFERTAKDGDGTWRAMGPAGGDPPVLWTSEVHPHKIKKFVAVALVAVDLRRVDLQLVAGTQEPASKTVPADKRPGLVPQADLSKLIAAFNGGFKARHGDYGMMIAGDEFIGPRDDACTAALYRDGRFEVRTWSALASTAKDMEFYRQTPPCLVEEGVVHEKLQTERNTKKWGAAEDGKTEIRRSAIGVSQDGRTLFIAIGEWTTAQSLARALTVAGVWSAAQLDINYSFTRFTLYERGDDGALRATSPLLSELKFTQKGYIESSAFRDFFYLRHATEGAKQKP